MPIFHHVYVLQSLVNKSLCIGYSTNVKRRLYEHNQGLNTSTKRYIPWEIIYVESYLQKDDALGREKFLKGGSGRKYLYKQLKNHFESNPVSAKINPTRSGR